MTFNWYIVILSNAVQHVYHGPPPPSAISFANSSSSSRPWVGGPAGRLQSRHAATALQTAKLPRSYSTPLSPGSYPFPLRPLGPLHAWVKWLLYCWQQLVTCRPSLQLISGPAITTGGGLHKRLTIYCPRWDPLVKEYPGARSTQSAQLLCLLSLPHLGNAESNMAKPWIGPIIQQDSKCK